MAHIPSAIQNIYSIERQLFAMGVADGAVKLHTIQSIAEKNAGMSNIGIDFDTGRSFPFIDSQKKLADAANRGHLELQDSTTDLCTSSAADCCCCEGESAPGNEAKFAKRPACHSPK